MSEKQTSFTVTDKRKFTLDGELRDPSAAAAEEETHAIPAAASLSESAETFPEATPGATTFEGEIEGVDPDPLDAGLDEPYSEDDLGPIPTSQEFADQQDAYQRASSQLDEMIRQANPGAPPPPSIDFEQVVQSFYFSAAVAMGAAAEPGQKPRVDIIAARQSIDMLAVLADKTKGKLTERELKLLHTALFNLRVMFLEITSTLAAQASKIARPDLIR